MSSTRNYTSKVPEWLEQIENDRIRTLRQILREEGESGDSRYDANSVYNMSPEDLRLAASEFIDADKIRAELVKVPGVDEEQVASDTADMPPVEVWEYAQDTMIKAEVASRTSTDPEPSPVSVEDVLRWAEAEERAIEREIIQQNYPDQDLSDKHDDEVNDIIAEDTTKALIGKDGSPLDSETLIDHKRADLIGELTNEYGYDRDEINDKSLSELMEMHAEATESSSTSNDPMNPNQDPSGSEPPPRSPDPRTDRLTDRINDGQQGSGGNDSSQGSGSNGSPGSSSNQGSSLPESGTDMTGGLPGGGHQSGSGSDSGTGSSSGTQGSGGDSGSSDPTGPPPGSTHYGAPIVGISGEVVGGETGYRDADGNWYERDGSAMHPDKATRMEDRYQNGELNEGSTVPDDSSSDDSSDSDDTSTDDSSSDDPPPDDSEGVEFTPSGENTGSGPSPSLDQFNASADQYRQIIDAARGNSTINPTREDGEPHSDEVPEEENTLVNPKGVENSQREVTAPAGPDYGSSQGAGGIDYGPDANVDYGVGFTDEVPTNVGPGGGLGHVADQLNSDSTEEETSSGPLPEGVSAADLTVADNPLAGMDLDPVIPPQPVEPVMYMAVDDQTNYSSSTGSGEDETESTIDPRVEAMPVGVVSSLDVFDLDVDEVDDSVAYEKQQEIDAATDKADLGKDNVVVDEVEDEVEEEDVAPEQPEEKGQVLEPIDFDTSEPVKESPTKTVETEPEITFISEPAPEPEPIEKAEPAVEVEESSEMPLQVATLVTPIENIAANSEIINARLDLSTDSGSSDEEDDETDG